MDLFDALPPTPAEVFFPIAPGAVLLRGWARGIEAALLQALNQTLQQLHTPGGRPMSVRSSNCGALGWYSDPHGYRYTRHNPHTGQPWPALPDCFATLAREAAAAAGYAHFVPDACLINQYTAGAKMALHQDRDERDLSAPIVSVSLGLPAIFLFGGLQRHAPCQSLRLAHGDVVVWGGPSRLVFHGIRPLAAGSHPLLGPQRINLTLRQAG